MIRNIVIAILSLTVVTGVVVFRNCSQNEG